MQLANMAQHGRSSARREHDTAAENNLMTNRIQTYACNLFLCRNIGFLSLAVLPSPPHWACEASRDLRGNGCKSPSQSRGKAEIREHHRQLPGRVILSWVVSVFATARLAHSVHLFAGTEGREEVSALC